MKRTKGELIFQIFNYMILTFLALITVYPLIYTLSMSFSTAAEAAKSGFHLYPKNISVEAYNIVLKDSRILTGYFNTIFRTVVGTTVALLVTSLYAYATSLKSTPGRRFFNTYILITMIFSVGQIPAYLCIKDLGLYDSVWVYILPNMIVAYNTIVARSFFQSIPDSLRESAKIDGAGEFRIFFQIIVPLSKAIIMTLLLWIAVFHWNQWYDSMMYITNPDKHVVQLVLQSILQESSTSSLAGENTAVADYTPATVRAATIVVVIIPILAVYPFIQKYFIKGVMLGAVKG